MTEVRWSRGNKLGSGGFGTVYMAAATPINNKSSSMRRPLLMAVKTVDCSQSTSLLKEAGVLSSLQRQPQGFGTYSRCPFIIGYYGHDIRIGEQKQCNMFMELASHGSLRDHIRKSSLTGLPESQVKAYTKALLLGLDHIHLNDYVHCDIKPENILLSYYSSSSIGGSIVPKIADFGLAKSAGKQAKDKHGLRGTPLYMAPESICSEEYDPPCDVWALGCVVLEMLTGKPAWGSHVNEPPSSLLHRIAYTDEVPVVPDTLSLQAKQFISRCLIKDPDLRWSVYMLLQHSFVADETIPTEGVRTELKSHKHPQDFCWPSVIDLTNTIDSGSSNKLVAVPSNGQKRRKIDNVNGTKMPPSVIVLDTN